MKDERMGSESVLKLLMEFSIPAMIGMIVNAIYNIVDRMFIGNASDLGSLGLAGITITFPITLILMAFSLMIGVGGATRFSITLGKGDRETAAFYQGNALMLTILFGFIFMITGNLFIQPLLVALGASSKVLPYAQSYLSVILYGAVFQCISMCLNNFSRAQGNPKNAMVSMLIGAGFNIVFDYIFIYQFHMGMKGAAFATIGGQLLSALWQFAFIFSSRSIIPLKIEHFKLKFEYIKMIVTTGLPIFFMQLSNSLLNVVLNGRVGHYGGDVAISTVGIITSVQTFVLMPITGLCQGQQPLISYNYGAGKFDRVLTTLKYSITAGSVIVCLGFLGVQCFPETIIRMFNSETEVIELGTKALHIWYLCFFVVGAQSLCANYFQAMGKIKQASFLNLIRQVLILIPCIIIFSEIFGLYGVFWAVPVADAVAFCITVILTLSDIKNRKNNFIGM